jgi:hypothetical protein
MVGFLFVSFRCIGRKKKKWKEIGKIARVDVIGALSRRRTIATQTVCAA